MAKKRQTSEIERMQHLCFLTATHNPHSAENADDSYHFLPRKAIHADADADYDGYDGLQIRIEADEGGAYVFLPDGHEEICHECSKEDDVEGLEHDGC